MYGSLLIDCDSSNLLETKGINVMDSVQNMPKEIRNLKPWRKFRKSTFSSLSNDYYPVLKIVFVFLGPAVWPSVWFVRWTNSYSTRAYYTQQTWQCKGGSQGKTGLFFFPSLFFFVCLFLARFSSLPFFSSFFWVEWAGKQASQWGESQFFQVSSDFVFWLEGFAIVLILP